AWMPRISFKAGIRCPACGADHTHPLDVHTVLRDELTTCSRSGELVEELPAWLAEWKSHLQRAQPASPLSGPRHVHDETTQAQIQDVSEIGGATATAEMLAESPLHIDYLYASPLDAAPLDVRAELDALAGMSGIGRVTVRTATTETLSEVWSIDSPTPGLRVLCIAAHCAVEPVAAGKPPIPSLLLEDEVGRAHMIRIDDLDELLSLTGPEVAAGGLGSPVATPFDVVVLDACHSEPMARRFVSAGSALCAVACSGEVFDAAAREFLRVFLRNLAAASCARSACTALCAETKAAWATSAASAAFVAAQRAVRLSPQPGLRSEAERFKFILPPSSGEASGAVASTETCPPPPPWRSPPGAPAVKFLADALDLPQAVEDFVGRGSLMSAVAQALLGNRRVLWLYGRAGIGKSAIAAEFCRFYGLPGDRLFSPPASGPSQRLSASSIEASEAEAVAGPLGSGSSSSSRKPRQSESSHGHESNNNNNNNNSDSDGYGGSCGSSARPGSVNLLRLGGLTTEEVLQRLGQLFGVGIAGIRRAEGAMLGRRWLLLLDGVDDSLAAAAGGESGDARAAAAVWSLLGEALSVTHHLRIVLTSRNPRYDAPLSCKVVAYEVPPLSDQDSALLLARRSHRPLFPRDFDASIAEAMPGAAASAADPLALTGRRREFLQRLARHPLIQEVGGAPADILAAATEVTPQLPTLLAHPLLKAKQLVPASSDAAS
ncbi:unnamed protein product, partial [Polarella glacialis]